MRKYLIRLDAMERDFKALPLMVGAFKALSQQVDGLQKLLGTTNLEVDGMSLKLDVLVSRVTTPTNRSALAPIAASKPQMVAAIAALSKKVDGLLECSTAAPAPPTTIV
jgi:hypothetical protein